MISEYLHRATLALHVLRGRPLAYRITLYGIRATPNGRVVECILAGPPS